MPELPEVETTLRGIAPHIINQIVSVAIIRSSNYFSRTEIKNNELREAGSDRKIRNS